MKYTDLIDSFKELLYLAYITRDITASPCQHLSRMFSLAFTYCRGIWKHDQKPNAATALKVHTQIKKHGSQLYYVTDFSLKLEFIVKPTTMLYLSLIVSLITTHF